MVINKFVVVGCIVTGNVALIALGVFPLNFKLSRAIFTCLIILDVEGVLKRMRSGDYFAGKITQERSC